jgi:hypothetical protein
MSEALTVKWPWTMIWIEHADEFLAQIKDALPPDHELQKHRIFPGIKWERRPIFIVDDDTTGERILMDFERMKRWKRTRHKVPTMRVFEDTSELAAMIERDHRAESANHSENGSPK